MSDATEVAAWFRTLIESADGEAHALDALHARLRDAGLLPKVAVHRYMCARGCQLATVFVVADRVLCAVRDYKMSPGLNARESVASARAKNTLDGNRHWPSHVYDVGELEGFGTPTQPAGMTATCRHWRGVLLASDVLEVARDVTPGRPGAPTRLT